MTNNESTTLPVPPRAAAKEIAAGEVLFEPDLPTVDAVMSNPPKATMRCPDTFRMPGPPRKGSSCAD